MKTSLRAFALSGASKRRLTRGSWFAAIASVAIVIGIAFSAPYFPERFSDARAFYCAGRAVAQHADPYREHPLAECERTVTAPGLSPLRGGVTVPAPFPGYALALFALLSRLPFSAALALWMAASIAAVIGAIVLLARVTQTSWVATAIVVGFPAVTVALPLGQVTPFVLLALAAAAVLLGAQRPRLAALAALGAMLDPHVGLPLVLGIAAGSPRSRVTLILGLAGLAVLGVAVSGPVYEREYLELVLPAHARANVADSLQFSTTNFAYLAGVPVSIALAIGTVWYGAALVLGTVIAVRLKNRYGAVTLVLIPPAFAVFGGTYTHLAQLAMATPAFLMMCSGARGATRVGYVVIAFLAAIPWLLIGPFPFLFPAAAILATIYARAMNIEHHALRLGAATLAGLSAIFITMIRTHIAHRVVEPHVAGNPLAQVAWQMFVLARNSPPEYGALFAKAPTVFAFFVLFGVLVNAARMRGAIVHEC